MFLKGDSLKTEEGRKVESKGKKSYQGNSESPAFI